MSKNTISFAQWGTQKQLANLWQICFEEQPRPTSLFLNNCFQPQNCLLYKVDNQVAAMVHLLPARIVEKNRVVRAHYIYAAATLPQYRSKGYMSALIKCAAYVGAKRGDHYSTLLPANRGLYDYYAKFGYVPNFETRFLTLSFEKLQAAATSGQKGKILLTYQQLANLRNAQIGSQTGSVIWSARAMAYAGGINKLYGGRLICARTGNQFAYALGRMTGDGQCEIVEVMADDNTIANLAANILAYMPAQSYQFRLPNNQKLFAGQGKVSYFGMTKPLGGITLTDMKAFNTPYLGLTLD